MTRKHFPIGLTAIALLVLAAPGYANAEILSLDCLFLENGRGYVQNVWVDLDKSSVTIWWNLSGQRSFNTWPARITVTSISWGENVNGQTISGSIDRTTGAFKFSSRAGGGFLWDPPLQCTKGTTPLPATKF